MGKGRGKRGWKGRKGWEGQWEKSRSRREKRGTKGYPLRLKILASVCRLADRDRWQAIGGKLHHNQPLTRFMR